METILHNAAHVLLAFTVPPLLLGVINKTKAFFAGRVGPPVLQPYYDLIKLVQKGSVFSATTTWIFQAGPVVGLVTGAMVILLIPLADSRAPIAFTGDLILMVYLLGLGRFFTAAAALDTGSAFEGMGAAREVTFACLAEPAFFLGLLVLTNVAGTLELARMIGGSAASWPSQGAALALVLLSWFIVMLVENCRIPFDDPNTHLELTMVHEVMVLDHGGPALGMILYGASLKLFIYAALIVRLTVPAGIGAPWLDWPILVAGVLTVSVLVGVVESTMARLRLPHIPLLLATACLLSLFGVILVMVRERGAEVLP